MKIKKIIISNFRSINKLILNINVENNFISFAGANNVGKTNILNSLNLFFNNLEYNPEKDCPHHKFYGTRGGHYQPKIQIIFIDDEDNYDLTKDWNLTKKEKESGGEYKIRGKKNKKIISEKEIENIIEKINFFYLPSINVSFPDVIKYIMNSDVIDIETGNTRLSGKKGEMKKNIEKVLNDLKDILGVLGDNISPLLDKYKKGWGVAFDIPQKVNTFRDLMIGEVDFYIKDKSSSKAIDAKGAGLQRLSHVLMYFRIIDKLKEKKANVIIAIDEPDVYLHQGLQKELLNDIRSRLDVAQFFVTTHSHIFMNTATLSNVFLLDQKVEDKEYQRAKRKSGDRKFNAISTILVDINEETGITKLKKHLGIDISDNLLFDKYNILVEGDEDKIYLERLMDVLQISIPNIISVGGADNFVKFLAFYNEMSKTPENNFLILFDNDQKGREVFKKIKPKKFNNIAIKKKFIVSYFGFNPDENSGANIEIEDFLRPEILCYLSNKILKEKGLNLFSKKDINYVIKNIKTPAFQNSGILALLENKKNEINPQDGQNIDIDGSGVKGGMANLFKMLDRKVIKMIGENNDKENENIVEFLKDISKSFSNSSE